MQQVIRAIDQVGAGGAALQEPRPAAAPVGMVVIPAYNEEADVADVVTTLTALGYAVTVVDDGSADRTAERAGDAGAVVLRLAFHAGSWAAIQAGMRYAQARGCHWVVTVDADGQHDADDVPTLLDRLELGEDPDVVIGSCIGRANRRRRLAWRVLRRLSGLNIADLTSGFRAYNRAAVNLLCDGEQTLIEYQDVGVLMCLTNNGSTIREVEVRMKPRAHGRSRIFSSWPIVGYYLVYSALIGASRRRIALRGTGSGSR